MNALKGNSYFSNIIDPKESLYIEQGFCFHDNLKAIKLILHTCINYIIHSLYIGIAYNLMPE